jgi:hypothetical protein
MFSVKSILNLILPSGNYETTGSGMKVSFPENILPSNYCALDVNLEIKKTLEIKTVLKINLPLQPSNTPWILNGQ